jgi:hypothetical protein
MWIFLPRKPCVMLLTLLVMVLWLDVLSIWLLLLLLLLATMTRLRDITPFLFMLTIDRRVSANKDQQSFKEDIGGRLTNSVREQQYCISIGDPHSFFANPYPGKNLYADPEPNP